MIGAPERVFETGDYFRLRSLSRYYDIAPDGRFVFVRRQEDSPVNEGPVTATITVVQNWFGELTRLATTDSN